MTENTPSDAMAIWEAAYSAAMLAGIDDQAAAAVIADALAERDAEIARLRETLQEVMRLLSYASQDAVNEAAAQSNKNMAWQKARAALGSAKV